MKFRKPITSPAQLKEILGTPSKVAANKAINHIDKHCRAFIEQSPFVVIGSADGQSSFDLSPKGDPPGFVKILDEKTLAIPDRLGNRRADTFLNILENPRIGLIFLIPGIKETLRVSGTAQIIQDKEIRAMLAHKGKLPQLALIVHVEEAMLHCSKCMIRSRLWEGPLEEAQSQLPSLAQAVKDHADAGESVEELDVRIKDGEKNRLY